MGVCKSCSECLLKANKMENFRQEVTCLHTLYEDKGFDDEMKDILNKTVYF